MNHKGMIADAILAKLMNMNGTQKGKAVSVGVRQEYLSAITRGRAVNTMSTDLLVTIARAFGIGVELSLTECPAVRCDGSDVSPFDSGVSPDSPFADGGF